MKIKRLLSLVLACTIVMTFSHPPVWAQETDFIGTVHVEYSDTPGIIENLRMRVKGELAYVDAQQISERLGYLLSVHDDRITMRLYNSTNSMPTVIDFFSNATHVEKMMGASLIEFEAPFKTIHDEYGIWFPLDFTLKICGGSCLVTPSALYIKMPDRTIYDDLYYIRENNHDFAFNLLNCFDHEEWQQNAQALSNHGVRVLSEFLNLLFIDGQAWTNLGQTLSASPKLATLLDRSIAEKLATLMCTCSDAELKALVKEVNAFKDVIEGSKSIGQIMYDFTLEDVDSLTQDYVEKLRNIIEINEGLDTSNKIYDKLLGLAKNLQVTNGINEAAKRLYVEMGGMAKGLATLGGILSSMDEFNNSDSFALAAMSQYLDYAQTSGMLSEVAYSGMKDSTVLLNSDIASYSLAQYIQNDLANAAFDMFKLTEGLPAQYRLAKLGWDLASKYIPYLSNGLSAADEFEMSLLASIVQSDMRKEISNIELRILEEPTAEKLYLLAQYLYVYVKAGCVARETAVSFIDHSVDDANLNKMSTIAAELARNADAVAVLARLKTAMRDNSNGYLGFLPEDNEEYLQNFSDKALVDFFLSQNKVEPETERYEPETDGSLEPKGSSNVIPQSTEEMLLGPWYRNGEEDRDGWGKSCPTFTLYSDGTATFASEYSAGTWALVNKNQLKLTNYYGESEVHTLISLEPGKFIIEDGTIYLDASIEDLGAADASSDSEYQSSSVQLLASDENRYKINKFLSDFSMLYFNENRVLNEETGFYEVGTSEFEANESHKAEMLDFAWLYSKVKLGASEVVSYNGSRDYFGIKLDTINRVANRFFGIGIGPEDVAAAANNGFYLPEIVDGMVIAPMATGALYHQISLAKDAVELENKNVLVNFDSFWIDDRSIALGTVQDDSVYYHSHNDVASKSSFEYTASGCAVIRPWTSPDGEESYQLVAYYLNSDKTDELYYQSGNSVYTGDKISQDEALAIAKMYWASSMGDEEIWTDKGIRTNKAHEKEGVEYYSFTLTGSVDNHSTALDYLFINSLTGDCYFGLSYPEKFVCTDEDIKG